MNGLTINCKLCVISKFAVTTVTQVKSKISYKKVNFQLTSNKILLHSTCFNVSV